MDTDEFAEVNAEIVNFLDSVKNDGVGYWSSCSVLSL